MRAFHKSLLLFPFCSLLVAARVPSLEPLTSLNQFFPQPSLDSLLTTLTPETQASLVTPKSSKEAWANATLRWNDLSTFTLRAALTPSTVSDLEKIVRFAHRNSIPVHPSTSTHGWSLTLRGIKNGIKVNLRPHFTGIHIASTEDLPKSTPRNTRAIWLGGGSTNLELVEFLYANRLRSALGSCDCVGPTSLSLGAGMGRYAGTIGLVTDGLLAVDIITPSRGLVRASRAENPELFWGVRGAGHNLGVVVRSLFKTLSIDEPLALPSGGTLSEGWDSNEWLISRIVFPASRVKEVAQALELWRLNQDFRATIYVSIERERSDKGVLVPIIILQCSFFGPRSLDKEVFAIFQELGPLRESAYVVPWNRITREWGESINDPICLKVPKLAHSFFHAQISRIEENSMAKMLELLETELWPWTDKYSVGPPVVWWELYPQHAVRAAPDGQTAYPWRKRGITTVIIVHYDTSAVPRKAERQLVSIGEKGRKIFNAPEKDLAVYVNYATGTEGTRAMYGDKNNLKRLRKLKRVFDPKGILSGYNPVK